MSKFNKIFFPLLAVTLGLTACTWNDAKNLDYTKDHISREEADPAGYEQFLTDLRAYRETDHLVMIAGVDALAEKPIKQSQRLSSLPDSVDFVWLKNIETLHPEILAEIESGRERKGQQFLGDVNYDAYMAEWDLMQSKKEEAGEPLGTDEESVEFVKNQAKADLAKIEEYNLDGLIFSANGRATKAQDAFIQVVKDWHAANGFRTFMFRGSVKNISDYSVYAFCKYLIVVCDEGTTTATGIASRVRLILGNDKSVPKDRSIIEVTVPNADVPEQKGAAPQAAAEWAFENKDSRKVKSSGVLVNNADDDYYRADLIYRNVRGAMTIMAGPQNDNEEAK